MEQERWQRIKALFAAASAIPQDRRAEFLLSHEPDEAIRLEVASLLAAGGEALDGGSPTEGPGTRVGAYKLLEVIGEGGFGTVYLAEQESPIRRRVALKVIKAGMDSRQVVARFEQERQALAMMDHPNIARVFDGGATPSGRPFFVMELVKGDPVTDYCDRERLTTSERLSLFADIARAVQHAHQKGVIHRDLKPGNVLVTLIDGKAIPKVIDFGVAKATRGPLTEKTLFTEHKQFLGTPLYMSPEQAQLSGVDVDTRSDVYSLGVLLYELLTGTTPFRSEELIEAGVLEMFRVLREVDPPKPSTRVATLGKSGGALAAQRRLDAHRLGALLRGDLDWIVMKCLEKERARRYDTATELVRDIERHLAGEAVVAAPPSVGYRVRKLVARRKGSVAVVATLLTAALLLPLLWGWSQSRLREEAETARVNADRARRAAELVYAAAADASILRNDAKEARRRLDACPPELRGWEWAYLDAQADTSVLAMGTPSPDYADQVLAVSFQRDGRAIHASTTRSTLRSYDAETGKRLRSIDVDARAEEVQYASHHASSGKICIVSRAPRAASHLVSAADRVTIIDTESGALQAVVQVSGATVDAVPAFSGDGSVIGFAVSSGQIVLCDVASGAELHRMRSPVVSDWLVALDERGERVVAAGRVPRDALGARAESEFGVYRAESKIGYFELKASCPNFAQSISCNQDASKIIAATGDGPRLWTEDGGAFVKVLAQSGVAQLCVSAMWDKLVVATYGGPCFMVPIPHYGSVTSILGSSDWPTALAFSSDDQELAVGGADGTLRIWKVDLLGPVQELAVEPLDGDGAVSGDGSTVALREVQGEAIEVFDPISGGMMLRVAGHASSGFMALSESGDRLVFNPYDGPVVIWDSWTGELLRSWDPGDIVNVCMDDAGAQVVMGRKGVATIWTEIDAEETRDIEVGAAGDASVEVVIGLDGDAIAMASKDGSVVLLRRQDSASPYRLHAGSSLLSVALDQQAECLAVGSQTSLMWWADIWTGSPRCDFKLALHHGPKASDVRDVLWSPSLRFAVVVGEAWDNAILYDRERPDWHVKLQLGGSVGVPVAWLSDRMFYGDRVRLLCLDLDSGRHTLSLTMPSHWPAGVMASGKCGYLLAADPEGGNAHIFHSTPNRERYPLIMEAREAATAMRARIAGAPRAEIQRVRREVRASPSATDRQRAGARIALCEAEEALRVPATAAVQEAFDQYGRRAGSSATEVSAALQRVRAALVDFPDSYWFRAVHGVLLYRSGDFTRAKAELDDAAKERRRYRRGVGSVESAFSAMSCARLGQHEEAANHLARFRDSLEHSSESLIATSMTPEEAAAGYPKLQGLAPSDLGHDWVLALAKEAVSTCTQSKGPNGGPR